MTTDDPATHTIIKASYVLLDRVGGGSIPRETIKKSQAIMNVPRGDFVPLALKWLADLDRLLGSPPRVSRNWNAYLQKLTVPIMEMKGNAKFFGYDLVTDLTTLMLGFLEGLHDWNDDAHDVVHAHAQTLRNIVEHRTKGSGDKVGRALVDELQNAIGRYHKKYSKPTVA